VPTFIGYIFLFLSLCCFIKGSSYLFSLLVFSGIFQAATVTSSSAVGMEPYYLVALFFLVRCSLNIMFKKINIGKIKGIYSLFFLLCVGITSAFVCPFIFRGMLVYYPPLGLDDGFYTQLPLEFSAQNVSGACRLVINAFVVLFAAIIPGKISAPAKVFFAAFWLLLCIMVLQMLCFYIGLPFPSDVINNNHHMSIANLGFSGSLRPNGTFSEPSTEGCMLVAVMMGSIAMYIKKGKGLLLMGGALLGILLIASTTAFLALGMGFILVMICYPIVRFPCFIRITRLKRAGILALLSVCSLSALVIPVVRNSVVEQTLNKGTSSLSLAIRIASDVYAFQVAYNTFGIGVGLGSTRASSFISTTLSTIGVTGFLLFVIMTKQFFQNELGEYFWLKWLAVGMIVNMSFGVPDITLPLLWIPFALIARAAQPKNIQDSTKLVTKAQ
jgi:hypothetical protein